MNDYYHYTNCVHSNAAFVNGVMDNAREVTYNTLKKYVSAHELENIFPYYDWGNKRKIGLTLKNDYAVSFYTSKYKGKKYAIVKHSAIEYFFKKN